MREPIDYAMTLANEYFQNVKICREDGGARSS
jgi:hypothetical protein